MLAFVQFVANDSIMLISNTPVIHSDQSLVNRDRTSHTLPGIFESSLSIASILGCLVLLQLLHLLCNKSKLLDGSQSAKFSERHSEAGSLLTNVIHDPHLGSANAAQLENDSIRKPFKMADGRGNEE